MYQSVKGSFVFGQHDKAAVSFEVLDFLCKGPRSVKRDVNGMSRLALSQWTRHFWMHPMSLGLTRKRLSVLECFKDQLKYRLSAKPKQRYQSDRQLVSIGLWDWILNFTTVCLKLMHLCHVQRHKSCIVKGINSEEVIHLIVQGDPVTL